MTRILVTGSTGFIGRHLIPQLSDGGHEVVEANRESGDVADEATWLKWSQVEVVIHLAGKTFVPDSWIDPAEFIKCNLLGTVAALNYCKRHNARLIFLSSYLYGKPTILPIPETAPLFANNPYALSKKMAEEACRFYSEAFGSSIIILRPFNVYGPGQPDTFLIPSIIRQINTGQAIRVKDLEPKRDYVYVSDVVRAIVRGVHCDRRFAIFNIGSGISYSVGDLIQIIQDLRQSDVPVYSYAERRRDEIMDTVADIREAQMQLGWAPQWTLHQGLCNCLTG
jgi:GDP-4-dehydro-6-deoxy-D-mannose reductase